MKTRQNPNKFVFTLFLLFLALTLPIAVMTLYQRGVLVSSARCNPKNPRCLVRNITPTPTTQPWLCTVTPVNFGIQQAPQFRMNNGLLTITTSLMEMDIYQGLITRVQAYSQLGESVIEEIIKPASLTSPTQNLPSVSNGLMGFTSKDTIGNYYLRWPLWGNRAATSVFSQIDAYTVKVTYDPLLYGDLVPTGKLVYTITVDPLTGEILLKADGTEMTAGYAPFTIDIPIVNISTPVILGSGVRYEKTDPSTITYTSYYGEGIYAPSMFVVEGLSSVFSVWSENSGVSIENIELRHNSSAPDIVVLRTQQDYKQINQYAILSPTWRFGTYKNWNTAAKRWRERFEARTGAKPLWNNAASWVRTIHASYPGLSNYDPSKFSSIASAMSPENSNLLYFLWNGDRIALFGDHTLVNGTSSIPNPTTTTQIKDTYGWKLMLYHPYTLIYQEDDAEQRRQSLINSGQLPANYPFTPDYANYQSGLSYAEQQQRWQNYWNDVKIPLPGFDVDYLLHPGASKTRNYIVENFAHFSATHRADGAYFDTSGSDAHSGFKALNKAIIEGNDFLTGEKKVFEAIQAQHPQLGVMTEFQAWWLLPYSMFTWEGTDTHTNQLNVSNIPLPNHPLRSALVSSYAWTSERRQAVGGTTWREPDYKLAAYLGTLPELTLAGDYQGSVTDAQARWTQARARLFGQYELFHDIPDTWDQDAMAYYRSNTCEWIKFKPIGSTYGYLKETPQEDMSLLQR
jgi:hypothetical protein